MRSSESFPNSPTFSEGDAPSVPKKNPRIQAIELFALAGISVLTFNIAGYNYFVPNEWRLLLRCLVALGLGITTFFLSRRDSLRQYHLIAYAFFTVAVGFVLASLLGNWWKLIPGLDPDSVQGWALAKIAEVNPIVLAILILNRVGGEDETHLYLKGGDHKKSLWWGILIVPLELVQFAVMTGFALNVNGPTFVAWLPWMLVFAFSNAFMEELMFRGLFLKRYETVLGPKTSVVLVAVVFGIFHGILLPFMGPALIVAFVAFTILLGWLWGRIIQQTGSIWGAVLAHATGDVLFILAAFGV